MKTRCAETSTLTSRNVHIVLWLLRNFDHDTPILLSAFWRTIIRNRLCFTFSGRRQPGFVDSILDDVVHNRCGPSSESS